MKKIILTLYVLTYICFAIYSYSQIDLNLTLSSNSLYQLFQTRLIFLGYYQRPLSTLIFILLLFLSCYSYIKLIGLSRKKIISLTNIHWLIIFSIIIGLISYPAFSHDIFNYMFDARILTKYNLSPYLYKALDFPTDQWTRFMHWTHRLYPYGPIWLIVSILPSFLGLQKFTLTLLLFKTLFASSYLVCALLIYKIAKNTSRNKLESLTFFAANPLIIIETLISPHNDIFILLLLLLSIYFLVKNYYFISLFTNILSVLVKYTTLPLLLVNIYAAIKKITTVKYFKQIISSYLILYMVSFIYLIYIRELLPWYAVIFVGLASLLDSNNLIRKIIFILSLSLPLKYLQYLYLGTWSNDLEKLYLWGNMALIILIAFYFVFLTRLTHKDNNIKLK